MNILTQSEYEVFNNYEQKGNLIKKLVDLCYPSFAKQNKSKKQSIDYIFKLDNLNFFDYCWFPINIIISGSIDYKLKVINEIIRRYGMVKDLNLSITNNSVIISGTGKAWLHTLQEDYKTNNISKSIYTVLSKKNSIIFKNSSNYIDDNLYIEILDKKNVQSEEDSFNILESEEDIKKHDWICINFKNLSKSFLLELLENKKLSVMYKKDYYDASLNFNFMSYDSYQLNKNSVNKNKIEECLNKIQEVYNFLLHRGVKRDHIRQILPLGITSEIMISGTIKDWEILFKDKIKEDSYWEIKLILNDLKQYLNEEYNYNF